MEKLIKSFVREGDLQDLNIEEIEEKPIYHYGTTVHYWHHDEYRKGAIRGVSVCFMKEINGTKLNFEYIIAKQEKGILSFLDSVNHRFVCDSKEALQETISKMIME